MNDLLYALLAAVLFFCGFQLLQRRHITYLVAGVLLMNHAVNIALMLAAPLMTGKDPFAEAGTQVDAVADPLPQALILTAIVITFGLVAFAIVAQQQYVEKTGQHDMDSLAENGGGESEGGSR